MAKRTVDTNKLAPDTTFMIQGILKYARLTSKIDGEELQKDIQRQQARGSRYPITRPYTTATICEAQVIPVNPNAQPPAPEDVYATESLYQSTAQGYTGYCFNANNTGNNVPWIGLRNPDGSVQEIIPEGELASDQRVTLVMRVYKTRQNNGVSLDGVIVENAPVRYYTGNSSIAALSARGIAFHPVQHPAPPAAPQVPNGAPAPVAPPANNQNAYSVGQQPQQPAYGQPQPNYGQPAYGQPAYGQPQQAEPPFTPSGFQGSEGQGIRYNPNDRQY